MSIFENFKKILPDSIFGLNAELKADPRQHKIDLLIGYYKNEQGSIPIFEAVKQAQKNIINRQKDLNYLPIDGLESFVKQLKPIIFSGFDPDELYGAQTVGGTSALHHLGKILASRGLKQIAIPDPSWANHRQIFEYLGFDVLKYPYYESKTHTLLFDRICEFLNLQSKHTVILLHASCHNPSGLDFTSNQWEKIAEICQAKTLFPFFDCAYQGFGDNLEKDTNVVNIFSKYLDEFFLAYSCSKNFGLYGERTGALYYYSKNKAVVNILASHFKQSIRATYSNPPRQGAMIVSEILSSFELKQLWEKELHSYQKRIQLLRKNFQHALETKTERHFSHITSGKGLFVMTGLNDHEVKDLREKHAVYLSSDGRLNITGLNEHNMNAVIGALSHYL